MTAELDLPSTPAFRPTPGPRIGLAVADRPSPSVWSALAGDPTLALPPDVLDLVIADQKRWSRRLVFPVARLVSYVLVTLIVVAKRVSPITISWHGALDQLAIRFIRRCVSPEGTELLLRHFVLETNLLELIARNAGVPDVYRPDLRPVTASDLGHSAVIEHDVNVLHVLASLGGRSIGAPWLPDTSMLQVGPIDVTTHRRWLNLDIETALYLMNIPFALFLTANEYRRAVRSLDLDHNLLECLATITAIDRLRNLAPAGSCLLTRTVGDVPGRLYTHAVIHEMAHHLIANAFPADLSEPSPCNDSEAYTPSQ